MTLTNRNLSAAGVTIEQYKGEKNKQKNKKKWYGWLRVPRTN